MLEAVENLSARSFHQSLDPLARNPFGIVVQAENWLRWGSPLDVHVVDAGAAPKGCENPINARITRVGIARERQC